MGIFVLMNNLKLAQYAASELLLLLHSRILAKFPYNCKTQWGNMD